MRILVDTCIWSNVFRYKQPVLEDAQILRRLVEDDRAVIIGPIRQEFLSGIKDLNKFATLRMALRAFPDLPLKTEIFEMAAFMFNECRIHGISASITDMTICATAKYYGLEIWTNDGDFARYQEHIDISCYQPA